MGASLAAHMQGREQVVCAFFGDGATNTGRTWESLNMAAAWKLPLIAVCENNLYAVETFIGNVSGPGTAAGRAAAFGLTAERVDGQDVGAVHRAVAQARSRALAGEGPTFIEALTYRYHGHNTGEDPVYRPADEAEEWRASKDQIERLRTALAEAGLLDADAYASTVAQAAETVAAAAAFAEASPVPAVTAVTQGVYGRPMSVPGNPR